MRLSKPAHPCSLTQPRGSRKSTRGPLFQALRSATSTSLDQTKRLKPNLSSASRPIKLPFGFLEIPPRSNFRLWLRLPNTYPRHSRPLGPTIAAMADVEPQPGPLNYVLGFTLVGIAWGLTTPFIRKAAKDHHPPQHQILESEAIQSSWLKSKIYGAFFAVVDLLRNPRYAVPLLLNLTGSVWFFLLIGKAGKS